jgi:hypothetical protein
MEQALLRQVAGLRIVTQNAGDLRERPVVLRSVLHHVTRDKANAAAIDTIGSYILFYVKNVHQCAYYYAHRCNDGMLGITRKLLIRQDNLYHLIHSLTAIGARDHQLFDKLLWRLVTSPICVGCWRLMVRKIAVLFGLNRGVQPFYAACCFNELSRGFVLCLLNASFKTAVSQHHNSNFYAKIDDHDVHRADTGQILAQWWRVMASRVALDLPSWAMCLALYRLICMAIKMASKVGAFVRCCHFFV